jgi:metallo-beta-lactamase family protein
VPVAPGVTAEFINAGHLLGSSYVRLTLASSGKAIVFGGDLGRYGRPVLPDPLPVDAADILLVESTYGDRTHESDNGGVRLAEIINRTSARGGKLIIPTFALGRVEELLYWVHQLEMQHAIPELPVYVDSPMATEVLEAYRRRVNELDPDLVQNPGDGHRARAMQQVCAFCTAKLRVVASIHESQRVQESSEPSIVISASGMATGGRVLHHLARALPDARNTVLFAGYQAAGTRGRLLKDGAKFTRIHGQDVVVRAEIQALDSMSAHADSNEIMQWLGHFKTPPKLTCLVHGETGPMDALKARIERELKWNVKTPMPAERMDVSTLLN